MLLTKRFSMNVAMISRITLHLRKEAHRTPKPPATHTTYDHTSFMEGGHFSAMHFNYPNSLHGPPDFLISVQEHSVMHDDHGDIVSVKAPKKAHPSPCSHGNRASWEGEEEWHEFAPVSTPRRGPWGRKHDTFELV